MTDLLKDLVKVNWSLGVAWIGVDMSMADVDHAMKALLSFTAIVLSILTYVDNKRKRRIKHGNDTEIPNQPGG